MQRTALAILLFLLPGTALAGGSSGKNVIHAHSMTTRPGVSSCYRFSVRVEDADAATIQWKICVTGGFTPIMPLSGTVDPDFFGWDDLSIPFSPPVGLCPGDTSSFTIKLCVDGMEVACKQACINLVGSKAGLTYVAAEPVEPYAFIGNRGKKETIRLVVPNDEPDLLPHAYDFLFEADDLAPGLDLYTLTPVSGFDLPTVIGAGTPLMSGKLEEIPPGDELLVEIEVQPPPGRNEGSGADLLYSLLDDDSPAESRFSSALVVRCHGDDTEARSVVRNGTNANPGVLASVTPPMLGRTWRATVDTSAHPGAYRTVVLATTGARAPATLVPGELLIDLELPPVLASSAAPIGGRALHRVPLPADPALDGRRIFAQAAVLGPEPQLTNALELVLAPVAVRSRCTFAALRPTQRPAGP